jgi:hypothetical protein
MPTESRIQTMTSSPRLVSRISDAVRLTAGVAFCAVLACTDFHVPHSPGTDFCVLHSPLASRKMTPSRRSASYVPAIMAFPAPPPPPPPLPPPPPAPPPVAHSCARGRGNGRLGSNTDVSLHLRGAQLQVQLWTFDFKQRFRCDACATAAHGRSSAWNLSACQLRLAVHGRALVASQCCRASSSTCH